MKKIISIVLILVMCLGLVACGTVGTSNEEYGTAISELRYLLENYMKESDLRSPDYYIDLGDVEHCWPLTSEQELLKNLYHQFAEMGDYKQAKEIAERFSVVENRYVSVSLKSVDAFGQEHDNENYEGYLLDAQGRRVWVNFQSFGGAYALWAYDDNGNLVRDVNTVYIYNEQDQCIESRSLSGGFIDSITNYSYDTQGNCTEAVTKMDDGNVTTDTYTYEFDEHGRYVRKYKNGELVVTYTYDDQGRCVQTEESKTGQTLVYTYIYNDHNVCILKLRNLDGKLLLSEVYSEAGNPIFTTRSQEEITWELEDYQYEDGLPVCITFADGSVLTFEYTPAYYFDAEGLVLPE